MSTLDGIATFTFPNRILFGEGSRRMLGDELVRLGVSQPLVVSDRGVQQAGLLDDLKGHLRDTRVSTFTGVQPNPTEADCLAGLDCYRTQGCDSVVGLGGGSALDAAKAIRLLTTHPGNLADYDVTAGGLTRVTVNLPPMVAIPTTAGTGSESSRGALIQLPQSSRKTAILSPHLLPNIALCDPELTYGLPCVLTAATGMDAFSHAVESYLCPAFHPICDGIALQALRYLARGLEASVRDGSDRSARRSMMAAALMAGISFHKGLGAVHALSHALGSQGRVHHGTVNAILLPHVLRFNRPVVESRMIELGSVMGLGRTSDAAGHFITLSELLLARLPLPNRLRELPELDQTRIPQYAQRATLDHCLRSNPRPASQFDLETLLERAW